eukprot:2870665-Prymnesium_polylepis.1
MQHPFHAFLRDVDVEEVSVHQAPFAPVPARAVDCKKGLDGDVGPLELASTARLIAVLVHSKRRSIRSSFHGDGGSWCLCSAHGRTHSARKVSPGRLDTPQRVCGLSGQVQLDVVGAATRTHTHNCHGLSARWWLRAAPFATGTVLFGHVDVHEAVAAEGRLVVDSRLLELSVELVELLEHPETEWWYHQQLAEQQKRYSSSLHGRAVRHAIRGFRAVLCRAQRGG